MMANMATKAGSQPHLSSGPSLADAPCALQIGATPSSVYREHAPPPALKPYVICAWTLEIRRGDQQHRQRVLPDGCSDIVWIGDAAPIVVGPMTRAALSTTEAGTTLVGLRFRPEVAATVLGVAAHELADRHIPLHELWHRRVVDDASEQLRAQHTTAGRVDVAQTLLAWRRGTIERPDPAVRHAVSLLTADRPERIERVARRIGISERHLRRRFVVSVGYSPKMFQRIVRFQKLLAIGRGGHPTRLDQVALCAGYADQAHMTREVSEFAGVTPSTLLGRVASALTLSDL